MTDDRQAEKMFIGDPSVGAGPGGFRVTGHEMVEVMNHIAHQVKQLGSPDARGRLSALMPTLLIVESPDFDKLVVATGSFSTPIAPPFATSSYLPDPTVHTALYSRQRDVIVVGASKSILDTVERLASNGYCVTLVLRNAPYLARPAAKDPKTGTPADTAGAAHALIGFLASLRRLTSHVPYFKDPVTGLRSTGGSVASLFRIIVHTTG
ncbi:hypothetical protein EV421DRAFT_1895211 [Armillaria borealis]|uniref:FAD/NAD(P)-binding domain-containing protein n=1 Tax=Armillaria borealis TaxID=47425 RepID=A0AA39N2M5_9AGAR|nr:hypothetical protein EV421DRAFT_1895211 [Armillaria borealis]